MIQMILPSGLMDNPCPAGQRGADQEHRQRVSSAFGAEGNEAYVVKMQNVMADLAAVVQQQQR